MILLPITENNLKTAVAIQRKLFPNSGGEEDILTSIGQGVKNKYYRKLNYWIIMNKEKPAGIIGLYSYIKYPDDAWIGWFGVLKKFRRKGIASIALKFFETTAEKYGFKNIRCYTNEFSNADACRLYKKYGMLREQYKNKNDAINENESIIIFSKSLNGEKCKLWNNKNLYLMKC